MPRTLFKFPKKAHASVEPLKRVLDSTPVRVEPPLTMVDPKTAKNTAGAMTALQAKNHWIRWYGIRRKGIWRQK